MGLIRTIFIIITIYYIVKFFTKYIAPFLLVNYVQKKAGQSFEKQTHVKEGTTTIDKKPNQNSKKIDDNIGEYVDYEEVD